MSAWNEETFLRTSEYTQKHKFEIKNEISSLIDWNLLPNIDKGNWFERETPSLTEQAVYI